MKACNRCGDRKATTEFYRNCKASDGLTTLCKSCIKESQQQYREANAERLREYDRSRSRKPQRIEAARRRHLSAGSNPETQARRRANHKKWAAQNSQKLAAEMAAKNAVRDGKLFRQPCERCGTTKHVHAHHEDYSKPLDVMWLCPRHHGERHREINAAQRRAMQEQETA